MIFSTRTVFTREHRSGRKTTRPASPARDPATPPKKPKRAACDPTATRLQMEYEMDIFVATTVLEHVSVDKVFYGDSRKAKATHILVQGVAAEKLHPTVLPGHGRVVAGTRRSTRSVRARAQHAGKRSALILDADKDDVDPEALVALAKRHKVVCVAAHSEEEFRDLAREASSVPKKSCARFGKRFLAVYPTTAHHAMPFYQDDDDDPYGKPSKWAHRKLVAHSLALLDHEQGRAASIFYLDSPDAKATLSFLRDGVAPERLRPVNNEVGAANKDACYKIKRLSGDRVTATKGDIFDVVLRCSRGGTQKHVLWLDMEGRVKELEDFGRVAHVAAHVHFTVPTRCNAQADDVPTLVMNKLAAHGFTTLYREHYKGKSPCPMFHAVAKYTGRGKL